MYIRKYIRKIMPIFNPLSPSYINMTRQTPSPDLQTSFMYDPYVIRKDAWTMTDAIAVQVLNVTAQEKWRKYKLL